MKVNVPEIPKGAFSVQIVITAKCGEREENMEHMLSATSLLDVLREFESKSNYEALRDIIVDALPELDKREMQDILSGVKLPQLTSDVIAKKVFSPEEHPDRANFLLQHITGDPAIAVDSATPNEGYAQSLYAKKMIFDIPVKLLDERRASIEIQVAAQDFIIDRAELYSADMLLVQYSAAVDQKKGDIDFSDVKGAMVIVLMRHSPEPFRKFDKVSDRYIHRFDTMIADSGLRQDTLKKLYLVQLDKARNQFLEGKDAENDKELQALLAMMADVNHDGIKQEIRGSKTLTEIYDEVKLFVQNKEVQSMLLAEKYATADFNAVKSHERRVGAAKKEAELLETATQNYMKQQPELSRDEALDKAKALLGIK